MPDDQHAPSVSIRESVMKSVDAPNRPLKVFLCHAHPDADKVHALYARLKADGVDAWLDKENTCGERSRTIIPGQDWEMEIRKAVRERIGV